MKQFTGYMHGIDLGGWLSQCAHTHEHYESFITEEDFKTISGWGLDHVRVPVDYDLVEEKDGTYIEYGFDMIRKVIGWCGKYGLNMVLDLHKTFGFSFDDGEQEDGFFENRAYQERFCRLWETFAERFGKYEDRLCFELLNEVTDAAYSETWNKVIAECIAGIRKTAPTIKIVVGGCLYNHIYMMERLDPPADENIVYNFHFYDPLIFTHQGAYWIASMDTSFRMPLHTTYGEYAEKSAEQLPERMIDLDKFDKERMFGIEFFENYMEKAAALAEKRGTALYCGEYGVIDRAEPADILDWYKMISACFDRFGIGRAAWSYKKMDFGLADPFADGIRDELIRYL